MPNRPTTFSCPKVTINQPTYISRQSSGQEVSKETQVLNDTLDQKDFDQIVILKALDTLDQTHI